MPYICLKIICECLQTLPLNDWKGTSSLILDIIFWFASLTLVTACKLLRVGGSRCSRKWFAVANVSGFALLVTRCRRGGRKVFSLGFWAVSLTSRALFAMWRKQKHRHSFERRCKGSVFGNYGKGLCGCLRRFASIYCDLRVIRASTRCQQSGATI